MRVLMYLLILTAVAIGAISCDSSSTIMPPAGLGDEVRIPAELQVTMDEVEALIQAQGDDVIEQLLDTGTLAQRRALLYRAWDTDDEIVMDTAIVFAYPDTAAAEDSYAQSIAARFGATVEVSLHWITIDWYIFDWPADWTLGELAWIADKILQMYPDTVRFVEPDFVEYVVPLD